MALAVYFWQPTAKQAMDSGVAQMQEIYDIARNSMISGHGRDKGIDCLMAVLYGEVGAKQKETNTIDAPAGASTNIAVTVTDPNTPGLVAGKVINVAVLNGDSATAVALKIANALTADPDVSVNWTANSVGANYFIEAKTRSANVVAVNIGHGAITGIAASANSTTTTAGVAPAADPQTLDFSAKFDRVDAIAAIDNAGAEITNLSFIPTAANPAIITLTGDFTLVDEYILNVYGAIKR